MVNEEISEIVKMLSNEDPALRQLALEKLIPFKDNQEALDIIIKSLQDNDKDVRSYAADILGDINDRQALIALTHALEDSSWEVRNSAIESFGKQNNPETVNFIIASLRDSHPQVRYSSAKALKDFTSPSIIEPLFESLRDDTESVREEAKSTLLNFQVKVPTSLVAGYVLDYNKLVREVVVEFLTSRVEGNPVPHLEKASNDKDWEIRYQALNELNKIIKKAEIEDVKLFDINLKALEDRNAKVRYQAISNLAELKDARAIEPLGEIARSDEDSNNRLMATETMTLIRRISRLE